MDSASGDPGRSLDFDRSADIARTVENLIARGRVDALHTLAVALDAEADDLRTRLNRAEVALHHVAFALAETRGEAYVETLLRLLPNRPFLYKRLRPLAAALARSQSADVLLPLLARYLLSNEYVQAVGEYYHIELMGLVAHEMVVRGADLREAPHMTLLHNKLRGRRHPLAWLPLALTPLERELRIFLLPGPGAAFGLPPMDTPPPAPDSAEVQPMLPLGLPPRVAPLPSVRETTRTHVGERMKLAVANWFNMEGRVFSVEPAVAPADVTPGLVCALGLECLEQARAADIALTPAPPERILARLFAVACSGGPHEGYEGAYGRLYTWHSLGAMAGATPDDPIDDVRAQIEACRWFHFSAETDWFYQAGWDIGLLALRPDGETIAVLAATATD